MSVSRVTEQAEGSFNITETKTTATRIFHVLFTEFATSNLKNAVTATDGSTTIPAAYSLFPGYSAAGSPTVRSISVSQLDITHPLYQVTVDYSNEIEGNVYDRQKSSSNPANDGTDIELSFTSFSRVFDKDLAGTRICNSAGDSFDPPYEQEDYHLLISITKSISVANAPSIYTYQGTTNTDAVTIAGKSISAYYGFVKDIRAKRAYRGSTMYYDTTFQILVANSNTPGFKTLILDAGLRYLSGGVYVNFVDSTGNPTSPQLLNGSGAALAIGGTPVYKTFYTYPTSLFANMVSTFSLPTTLS